MDQTYRICFVCTGNICRSPMAEVVFNSMIATSKLNWVADSAGTGSWHSGQDMDRRAKTSLLKAGYSPSTHAAKQFRTEFFYDRDLIIALDMEHYEDLISLDKHRNNGKAMTKIRLLMSYSHDIKIQEVPDPYYGNIEDFNYALQLIESGIRGIISDLL